MELKDKLLIDFKLPGEEKRWEIITDVVMGGVSQSSMIITPDNTAIFHGELSLENYGGFALMSCKSSRSLSVSCRLFCCYSSLFRRVCSSASTASSLSAFSCSSTVFSLSSSNNYVDVSLSSIASDRLFSESCAFASNSTNLATNSLF